jgi:hypothetical protein
VEGWGHSTGTGTDFGKATLRNYKFIPALAFAIGTARDSAREEVEYYKVCARWVSKTLKGQHSKTVYV